MVADPTVLRLELRGGNAEFWDARDAEILVEGPRGTGKTRTILELINALCHSFPGFQALIVRKYAVTLASTTLKTFNEQVLHSGDGVQFYHGSQDEPASYRYTNGSRITVAGMDNPKAQEKLKSGEYDIAYAAEATDLTEDDIESLKATLRHVVNGKPLIPNQRLIGDCNPTYSSHHLNQRCERGQMRRIRTKLTDNPLMAYADGTLTEFGQRYLDGLPLKGQKRDSWVLGLWTGVENACYPTFDRAAQVKPLEPGLQFTSFIGEDYGSEHLCAVAVVSVDQYRRRWIREVWSGADEKPDPAKPSRMDLVVAQFKEKYSVRRGRVDPNQAKLALQHGFSVAKGGAGGRQGAPRLQRIESLEKLFYVYEGGRVPTDHQIKNLEVPKGPYAEPDSYGLYLVEGMPGIDELADEIEAYHYVYSETPKGKTKDVFRERDDRIAAVEYANEEYEEGHPWDGLPGIARGERRSNRPRAEEWVVA